MAWGARRGTFATAQTGAARLTHPSRRIAVVLPPNEGFSPEAVGAIGLMVQRLGVDPQADFQTVVIGPALRHPPFAAPCFQAAQPPMWLPASRTMRYVWGVATRLRQLRPSLIEVHNRPMIALALARRFPDTATVLVLHNDPQAMRGTASAAGRARLRGLARVVTVSPYVSERLMDGVEGWSPPPFVQPNCIELAAIPPPSPQERRDRVILFAGRLVPEKGVDSFIAACARVLPTLPAGGWPGHRRPAAAAGRRQRRLFHRRAARRRGGRGADDRAPAARRGPGRDGTGCARGGAQPLA